MPIDFPISPNINDTYPYGGTIWIWNGNAWVIQSSSIGSTGPQGATGSTPTIPIASDSITGVASFNSTNFSVSATGNVSITTVLGGTF
jgi:hypothetical protein